MYNSRPKLFSAALCICLAAAAVLVYTVASLLPSKLRMYDVTENKLYTLRQETEAVVKNLDRNVDIKLISADGIDSESDIEKILDRYSSLSGRLNVELVSQDDALEYGKLDAGSIVVSSGEMTEIIYPYELFGMSDRYYGGNYVYYYYFVQYGYVDCSFYEFMEEYGEQFSLYDIAFYELRLTTAIEYVTGARVNKVYALTEHGETKLDNVLTSSLKLSFTDIVYGSIKNGVPDDADAILIADPSSDLTEEELSALKEYLSGGGQLILITSYSNVSKLNGILSLCEEYGMGTDRGYIYEDDANYNLEGYKQFSHPTLNSDNFGDRAPTLSDRLLFSNGNGITLNNSVGKDVKSLLDTSSNAYSKKDVENAESTDFNQETDVRGQFSVAALSKNSEGGGVLWLPSAAYVTEAYDVESQGGNFSVFTASVELLLDAEKLDISGVDITVKGLDVPDNAFSIALTVAIILPLAIMLGWVIITFIRRSCKPQKLMISEDDTDGTE